MIKGTFAEEEKIENYSCNNAGIYNVLFILYRYLFLLIYGHDRIKDLACQENNHFKQHNVKFGCF